MIRAGVIGAGSMGRHHVRIYGELELCELIGVADPDESRAELAKQHGTDYLADYRDLLNKQPGLVTIAAPTALHHKLACEAIDAGCHLLVEKPLAATVEQARDIIDRANKAGRTLAVGHIERFNPAVGAMKKLVDSGGIGELLTMSNQRLSPPPGRDLGTGIILDLMAHDIDMISWLMGEHATHVFATGLTRGKDHEQHSTVMLRFPDGRSGLIEQSWQAPYRMRRARLTGTEHLAQCDLIEQWVEVYSQEPRKEALEAKRLEFDRDEPLRREIEDVVGAVTEQRSPLCNAHDGLYALKVSLAAIESSKTGEAVKIS